MGIVSWRNWEKVKDLVKNNKQMLLTDENDFYKQAQVIDEKQIKDYSQIRITLNCLNCGEKYTCTIAQYKIKGHEKLTCNLCSGKAPWTYERLKTHVEKNNARLLMSHTKFEEESKKVKSTSKIKLKVTCNNCVFGILENITINHYVSRNRTKCKSCTSNILSENISSRNKDNWEDLTYREKQIKRVSKQFLGERNPNYNPMLSEEDREIQRNTPENNLLRKKAYERDNYTCRCCGNKKGGNLVVHHLDGWNWAINKRYHLRNVITLCEDCHKDYHSEYGYGDNIRIEFNKWMKEYREDLFGSNKS